MYQVVNSLGNLPTTLAICIQKGNHILVNGDDGGFHALKVLGINSGEVETTFSVQDDEFGTQFQMNVGRYDAYPIAIGGHIKTLDGSFIRVTTV